MINPINIFYLPIKDKTILCEVYPPHHNAIVKKITFTITPQHSIKIKAPKNTSVKSLMQMLQKHIQWITQQLEKKPALPTYTQNELHFYLGKSYPLQIQESALNKQNITLKENTLYISLHYYTPYKVYALLDSWYHFQALEIFSARILFWRQTISWIDWVNHPPLLRVKKMTSRWGSYINRMPGVVTLNQHLIKAPINCIDYVILHELCHAAEPNHSRNFYNLLSKFMPNWKSNQLELQKKSPLFLYNTTPKAEN